VRFFTVLLTCGKTGLQWKVGVYLKPKINTMSWASGTKNRFFAEGLNSGAEVILDHLENTPAVRLIDHLWSLGAFSPYKRYYTAETSDEGNVVNAVLAEQLAYEYKLGGSAYHDVRRILAWSKDNLISGGWLADDFRVDLDTAEVSHAQSLIPGNQTKWGQDTGPIATYIEGRFTILSGDRYNADLLSVWEYSRQAALENAMDSGSMVTTPLAKLIMTTQLPADSHLDEITFPVFTQSHPGY
jgi:hypothetical protein